MSIRRPNTVLNKYYRVLFKLPSYKVVLVFTLIVFTIIYGLVKINSLVYLLYFILLLSTIVVYSRIDSRSVFRRTKRALALSLTAIIYALVVSLFTNQLIGLVSSAVVLIIAIQSLDGNSFRRYIVCVIPIYMILMILYMLDIIDAREAVFGLFSSIVLITIDYLIYIILSKYRVNDFKSVDLGTLYMWNWLEKRRDIESVFNSISVNTVVYPFILRSKDSVIVYTDIHYGPFSNTGSSELPRRLGLFLRNKGFSTLILHGMGSHERNLSHSKYIDSFIKLFDNILHEEGFEQKYYGLFRFINSEWVFTYLVFTDISLILVSRPNGGIDDLPYGLQISINKIAREKGIGRVVIIDTHNWELESEIDKYSLEKLLIDSLNIIDFLKKSEPVDVLTRTVCSSEKLPGVIDGEICLFELMGIDGRGHLILVYLRGNNIVPGLRNKLIDYIKNKFSDVVVEVLTNDEHSETGIYTGAAYIPVQSNRDVFKVIDKLMIVLRQKDFYNKLFFKETSAEYRLMGECVYKLVNLLERVYPLASIALTGYFLATPFLLYIIQYFLI